MKPCGRRGEWDRLLPGERRCPAHKNRGNTVDGKVTLAEALGELRRELYAAQDEGTDQQLQFEIEQAQLMLEVEFRHTGDGKVKVEVGVPGVKAGAEAGGGAGSTHRQTLTLTLQVHDQALGGTRAKIRRITTDNTSTTVPQPPATKQPEETPTELPSKEAVQKRPWEQ
ncbi:hypothetical protein GCM10010372_80310 [Streptomyces tauricus]|nr:hypothetical protein GCM10010372_80310 [Streptomyces tauricus]